MILPTIELPNIMTLAGLQSKVDHGDYNEILTNYPFLTHVEEGIVRVNQDRTITALATDKAPSGSGEENKWWEAGPAFFRLMGSEYNWNTNTLDTWDKMRINSYSFVLNEWRHPSASEVFSIYPSNVRASVYDSSRNCPQPFMDVSPGNLELRNYPNQGDWSDAYLQANQQKFSVSKQFYTGWGYSSYNFLQANPGNFQLKSEQYAGNGTTTPLDYFQANPGNMAGYFFDANSGCAPPYIQFNPGNMMGYAYDWGTGAHYPYIQAHPYHFELGGFDYGTNKAASYAFIAPGFARFSDYQGNDYLTAESWSNTTKMNLFTNGTREKILEVQSEQGSAWLDLYLGTNNNGCGDLIFEAWANGWAAWMGLSNAGRHWFFDFSQDYIELCAIADPATYDPLDWDWQSQLKMYLYADKDVFQIESDLFIHKLKTQDEDNGDFQNLPNDSVYSHYDSTGITFVVKDSSGNKRTAKIAFTA